jgi:hypothetical protein
MPAQRHGSTAHQLKHLITFNSDLNEAAPLSSALNARALTWLAGWLADVERCSCIKLLSCKIHELLLMSFPSQLLEILLDPKSSSGAVHLLHSAAVAASAAAAAAASLLLSLSSLAVSADLNISLLISSITSSSCSSGWLCFCSLLSCKFFWHMGRSS